MAAQTYEQWKAQFAATGLGPEGKDDTILRATYQWHLAHPSGDDLEQFLKLAESKYPTPGPSLREQVQQVLSPPNRYGHASAASTPTLQPASTASSGPAKPDAQSAVKTGNPAIDAAIAQALQGGTTSGSVTLWPSLGVDPQASVLGTGPAPKPSSYRLPPGSPTGLVPITQTADMWLKGLYKMSPQDLHDLQVKLWDQGWYTGTKVTDPSQIQYGRPDAATLAAYAEALGETARYNAAGQRFGINGVIDMGSPLKGQAKAGTGTPYQTTNPADLASALRSQAQQDLGRDATPQETAQYQQQYLSQEDAARRTLIAAGQANQTVGVTGPPSPSAGADQWINTHDLSDKIAYGAAVRQQAFFSMLHSPV